MCKLRVEELEPRLLLNGTRVLPDHSSATGICAARSAEISPPIELTGRASHADQARPSDGQVEIVVFWEIVFRDEPDRGPQGSSWRGPGPQDPGASKPQPHGIEAARIDTRPSGVGAAAPDAPPGATVAVVSLPLDANGAGRLTTAPSANVVAEVLASLATPMPLPHPENLAAGPAFRAEVQTAFASRPGVGTLPEGEAALHVSSPLLRGSPAPARETDIVPPALSQNPEPAAARRELPSPLLSGLLTELPIPSLPALEQDMQLFLGNIEHMGQRLAQDPEGNGFAPWILAGVAAAAACEFARRQLKRTAVPALGGLPLPGSHTEPHFLG